MMYECSRRKELSYVRVLLYIKRIPQSIADDTLANHGVYPIFCLSFLQPAAATVQLPAKFYGLRRNVPSTVKYSMYYIEHNPGHTQI